MQNRLKAHSALGEAGKHEMMLSTLPEEQLCRCVGKGFVTPKPTKECFFRICDKHLNFNYSDLQTI